jgi:hypothetical protein
VQVVIKRLDAHPVARENQTPLRLPPDRDGKHAAKACKAGTAPMQVGIERYLGIAVSRKTKSGLLEFGTQFLMIEDFPIENECDVAVRTQERLVPSLKVDYAKPCGTN